MDTENNGKLRRALYGLLNLMPQTKAFHTLNDRLKTLPSDASNAQAASLQLRKTGVGAKHPKDIDFKGLRDFFIQVQTLHEGERRKEVSNDVVTEAEAEKLFEMRLSESEKVEFSVVDDFDEQHL